MATDRELLKYAQIVRARDNGDFSSVTNAEAAVREAHRQTIVVQALLAAEAMASTTSDLLLFRTVRKIKIKAVRILPRAALTADNTNYATVKLTYDDDAGGSDTDVASVATTVAGSGNWTAQQSVGLTVTESAAEVDAGKALHFVTAKTASGVVVPVCFVEIDFEYI